jgi:hypothetical protein
VINGRVCGRLITPVRPGTRPVSNRRPSFTSPVEARAARQGHGTRAQHGRVRLQGEADTASSSVLDNGTHSAPERARQSAVMRCAPWPHRAGSSVTLVISTSRRRRFQGAFCCADKTNTSQEGEGANVIQEQGYATPKSWDGRTSPPTF